MVVIAGRPGCLDDGDGEQPLVVVLVQRLRILEPCKGHRRRIKTGEKAKVVTAGWGIELIQFHAALAI